MSPLSPVRAGAAAPAFVLHDPEGRAERCLSFPLPERPQVLAFVRGWSAASAPAAELRALRAQLRGLGAVLVVLADSGVWSFRPDDDAELSSPAGHQLGLAVARAARQYQVPAGHDAVFVVDRGAGSEDAVIRFAHTTPGPLPCSLAEALDAAARALLARPNLAAGWSRREWLVSSLVSGFALTLLEALPGCARPRDATPTAKPTAPDGAGALDVTLNINGADHPLRIDPRVSLLDALRERLGLTGTKKGCDHGQCGACTVHVDGRRVNACLLLAVMTQGAKIVTIEGLAQGDVLHPLQRSFITHDGFQCGYCTPGQIMSAAALLKEGRAGSAAEIREQMSGNLCRCGAYPNIVAAIQAAQQGA